MSDIVVFRFFLPIFLVLWMAIPMIGAAVDAKDVVQLAAREAARKASIVNDQYAVEQHALNIITGSGKPIAHNGITLFDPSRDVAINFYDGDRVTVQVTYHHHLLSPNLMTLIGGGSLGPTVALTRRASFERTW